jgi:uncharacterized protein (TIGR02284 family)
MVISNNSSQNVAEMLNDLVKINTDRITRYQKALDHPTLDSDLLIVFKNIIAESYRFKNELTGKMKDFGTDAYPVSDSISGQIHRASMDLSVVLSTNTRKAIMSSCQYNEDIAQHAYTAALNDSYGLDEHIYQLIATQLKAMKNTSDQLKKCRNEFYYENSSMRNFQYSAMMF